MIRIKIADDMPPIEKARAREIGEQLTLDLKKLRTEVAVVCNLGEIEILDREHAARISTRISGIRSELLALHSDLSWDGAQ